MRVFILTLFLWAGLAPGLAAQQSPLARAMIHVRADEWEAAFRTARPAGSVAADIVEWRRLRAGAGELEDYLGFLARNGDWPGLSRLRREGEAKIGATTPVETVLEFYRDAPALTGNGAFHLARALREGGQGEAADAELIRAWTSMPMTRSRQAVFLDAHGALLRPHHEKRLDMLLWRGGTGAAETLLSRVGEDWKALARARIALREDRPGVDALIASVPGPVADDPGLAYERFLWRLRRGRDDSAAELLLQRSGDADGLGRPELWAAWRSRLARRFMRDGDAGIAYDLASSHRLGTGARLAELEWLSGYIALRKLEDPEAALRHFRRFRSAVNTPISLGRAGYWEGRALEALGRLEEARAAYAFGGEFQTSFYGQLAAERAGLPMLPALAGTDPLPHWQGAEFLDSRVTRAAALFEAAGERNLAELFLTHVAQTVSPEELGRLVRFALSLDDPHLAVRVAKTAARQGQVFMPAYFPLHALAQEELSIPAELALAIARRESEFDPDVVSPAGARGLMQLMPGTARDVARELEVDFSRDALLSDWRYNARLGSVYLEGLVEEFGPSFVLVAAAYNAGPSRPRRWIAEFGDPRDPAVDPVDWIEHIPFDETRNYVMRVMESLPVYRARLSGRVAPLNLSGELRRSP